jgi:DNA repair exonuclease SbcCD nuclease subunit
MTNRRELKRAWIISDTHFGVRNSSIEWLDIMKDYFRNFFIPLLRREGRPGDFVLHCGDVFDSRNSLNLLVMNEAMEIFEEISNIMPIMIILGNHDIYRKDSNDVNSVKVLKWIPNVTIFEEPEILAVSGANLLLMPWRKSVEDETACVQSHDADYLFCHTDVMGIKFNKFTDVEHGLDLNNLKKFKRVYSGHIHYAQHKKNFRMVGCPYQMTRSDTGNDKGIWMIDFESDKETYYSNEISPVFIRVLFEKLLEMTVNEVNTLFRNNFVDVHVHPKWSLNFPFSNLSEELTTFKKLDFIPRSGDFDENGEILDSMETTLENFDVISLSEKVIDSTSHSPEVKTNLKTAIKKLYESVLKSNTEEFEN